MAIKYASATETIADTLQNVKADNDVQVASVERIIEAASAYIDRVSLRPPGYFAGVGLNEGTKQKISIIVDADGISDDTSIRLTLTGRDVPGSPQTATVNAIGGTATSASIAAALASAMANVEGMGDVLDVENVGDAITVEPFALVAPDPGLAMVITPLDGSGNPVDALNGVNKSASTVLEAGFYSPATVRRYRGTGTNYLQIGRHVPGTVSIQNVSPAFWYENEANGWPFAVDAAAQVFGNVGDYDTRGDLYDMDYKLPRSRLFGAGGLYLVTARWGFVETPVDIVMATKQIAAHIWDRGQGVFGQINPAGFVVERDIPKTAAEFIAHWRKREFELN
jgi:hypothetical protein